MQNENGAFMPINFYEWQHQQPRPQSPRVDQAQIARVPTPHIVARSPTPYAVPRSQTPQVMLDPYSVAAERVNVLEEQIQGHVQAM